MTMKNTAWKVPVLIVGIAIAGVLIWKFSTANVTKSKLIDGRWYLTAMEMDNGQMKYYMPKPDSNMFSDLLFVEHSGHLWVTFEKAQLVLPCEVTRNEVTSEGGKYTVFKILDLTADKLTMEAMMIGNIYLNMGKSGRKVEFINAPQKTIQ